LDARLLDVLRGHLIDSFPGYNGVLEKWRREFEERETPEVKRVIQDGPLRARENIRKRKLDLESGTLYPQL
jgi:hypothetical protein